MQARVFSRFRSTGGNGVLFFSKMCRKTLDREYYVMYSIRQSGVSLIINDASEAIWTYS